MQLIGGGAHGPQAAAAIRHVAAQNGVWSLGNFGGAPPKTAMSFYTPSTDEAAAPPSGPVNPLQQQDLEKGDYRFVFNSCGVGMVRVGSAFVVILSLYC